MSKISQISIKNFKAISEFEADFNGCTAIITAGNNKGKTSFLRGIPDRIRGNKPELITKQGEKDGKGVMKLTTGERFEWEYDIDGKDKLTFFTKEGYKSVVTKEIVKKFFPPLFDIDKFLNSSPSDQSKQLQKILGVDFTDINNRYTIAYNDRTEKNRDSERYHAKLIEMLEVPKVEAVDLTELQAKKNSLQNEFIAQRKLISDKLNGQYLNNKKENDEARKAWNDKCREIDNEVRIFNEEQTKLTIKYNRCYDALSILKSEGYAGSDCDLFILSIKAEMQPQRSSVNLYPAEPAYVQEMPNDTELKAFDENSRIAIQNIDEQILQASVTNQKATEYINYINYKQSVEAAKQAAFDADIKVKAIDAERKKMIESANMPDGISFSENGILVDGFPLDKNQISTSKLYCAALRIASLNLGDVKTLYFDASFLDRNTLAEIQQWANEQDLQLLIERPDFDGGEIKYEIIEETQNLVAA